MAVRLQTADGKIKEYQTVEWGGGGGEHDLHPAKYISNCGREWRCERKPQEECNHLECAIAVAEHSENSDKSASTLMPIFGAIWLFISFFAETVFQSRSWYEMGLIMGLFCILGGVLAIRSYHSAKRKLRDLIEFYDHGTIGGIKASVLEPPNR
jgi:uncharacterized protein (DUF983 family)